MHSFLAFLAEHWAGMFVLIILLLALGLFVNWLSWMFGWGRFKGRDSMAPRESGLGYVITKFFVEIINEFRHLLAMVMVFVFAGAVFFAMLPGILAKDITLSKMASRPLPLRSAG